MNESSLKRHARNHPTDPPSSKVTNQPTGPTDPPIDEANDGKAPPTEPSAKSVQPPLQADPPPDAAPVVAAEPAPPAPTGGSATTSNGDEKNKESEAPEDQASAILLVQAKPRPGPLCKVCHHDDRHGIEKAMAEGVPYTRIERMFSGISDTGIRRHRDECVGRSILAARLEVLERANLMTADAFRARLEMLVRDAETLVSTAKTLFDKKSEDSDGVTAENVKAVGAAIKTAEGAIVSLGKLLGLFPTGTTINIINHPHFSTTVTKIVDTICDECLAPVRKVLSEVA